MLNSLNLSKLIWMLEYILNVLINCEMDRSLSIMQVLACCSNGGIRKLIINFGILIKIMECARDSIYKSTQVSHLVYYY